MVKKSTLNKAISSYPSSTYKNQPYAICSLLEFILETKRSILFWGLNSTKPSDGKRFQPLSQIEYVSGEFINSSTTQPKE